MSQRELIKKSKQVTDANDRLFNYPQSKSRFVLESQGRLTQRLTQYPIKICKKTVNKLVKKNLPGINVVLSRQTVVKENDLPYVSNEPEKMALTIGDLDGAEFGTDAKKNTKRRIRNADQKFFLVKKRRIILQNTV